MKIRGTNMKVSEMKAATNAELILRLAKIYDLETKAVKKEVEQIAKQLEKRGVIESAAAFAEEYNK